MGPMLREQPPNPEITTDLLSAGAQPRAGYTPPVELDMAVAGDRRRAIELLEQGGIRVIDPVLAIAQDLYGIRHPDRAGNDEARETFVTSYINRRRMANDEGRGRWFHFPYDRTLVFYASPDDHHLLRTDRNIGALTRPEQDRVSAAKIAILGLSIGSNVARECRRAAIGSGSLLADFDRISPTNLNRLDADESDIGVLKTHHVAMANSRTNPWAEQTLLNEGLSASNIGLLGDSGVDVAVDEMDDFRAKAILREYARQNGIPIVMASDLGDRVQLDVERHDLGLVAPFNGRIKPRDVLRLIDGTLEPAEKKKLMKKVVGIQNMSARMIQAIMDVGSSRAGIPQLGTTASLSGVAAAIATREILLGRDLDSGRYVLSPRKIMKLRPDTTFSEALKIYSSIPKYMRRQDTPI